MKRVVVIGAGIAGLVAARRLVEAGADVTVLEGNADPGGHARTVEHQGFFLEWGPHTLMGKANTLIGEAEALGVPVDGAQGPGTRFIWRDGKLHALPHGPLGLFTSRVLSPRGWMRIFAEPFLRSTPRTDETVREFFTRRIGPEATDILVGSFVSGIHAGDPTTLAAAEAFPTLVAWEREKGSIVRGALTAPRTKRARKGIVVMRGGMGALTRAMGESLGSRLRRNTPATALSRNGAWKVETAKGALEADVVVMAAPPQVAARLITEVAPEIGSSLAQIPMSKLALVHFGGPDARGEAPQGFGALIPRGQGVRTLGVLFVGSQMPDRMPTPNGWLHAAFVGGATDPGLLDLSDDEIGRIAVADSAKITGFRAEPSFVHVIRHPAAIPQMRAGHRQRVAEASARFPDLVFAGNWVRGVSAEDAAVSGVDAARTVLERVGRA